MTPDAIIALRVKELLADAPAVEQVAQDLTLDPECTLARDAIAALLRMASVHPADLPNSDVLAALYDIADDVRCAIELEMIHQARAEMYGAPILKGNADLEAAV